LHWNKIRAAGSIELARAIKVNETVKILDVSFNSFTSGCSTHYLNDASKTALPPVP